MITEALTESQIKRISKIRQKWINVAYSGKFNQDEATTLIEWAYKSIGKEKPKIWYCDSPIMAREVISMIKNANIGANIGANIEANIEANIWANIEANIGANIRDNIGANIRDNIRANIWANIRDNIRANIRANIPCSYINWSDLGWIAFYDYFMGGGFHRDCFVNKKAWQDFYVLCRGLQSGVYEIYPFENICFAVKPPKMIIKNETGRLHNTEGPAVEFADGVTFYAINGRILPEWIWEQRETITREKFLQERNAEIRGGMYAVLGQKRVFDLIGAREVCRKTANNETYVLYQTNERIGDKYWKWVGVTCPSTGTNYLLGVPETVTCPIEAVAGTWGLSASEYIINQHT